MKSGRQCAFCITSAVWNTKSSVVAVGKTTFLPHGTRWRIGAALRGTSVSDRRADLHGGGAQPIVGLFNNGNGNGSRPQDRFAKQSVEALGNTARFFRTPSGQAVLWLGLVWLVLTGRIGFIFDSFLLLFGLITIAPVLAVLTFRWWLSRQLVEGTCPSCGATVTGLKGQSFPCTVCGNTVQGETTGSFSVKDPTSATIDIDAKEISD